MEYGLTVEGGGRATLGVQGDSVVDSGLLTGVTCLSLAQLFAALQDDGTVRRVSDAYCVVNGDNLLWAGPSIFGF